MVVLCPTCRQSLTLPDDRAGRRFACPHCRAALPDAFPAALTGAVPLAVPPPVATGYRPPPVHRQRVRAPGAVLSLVLGIIAVMTPWTFCVAIVLAILAILQAGTAMEYIRVHPDKYVGRRLAVAGRILGIVALAIQGPTWLLLPTLS